MEKSSRRRSEANDKGKIEKATGALRRAKKKNVKEKRADKQQEEALMNEHAVRVREAGDGCVRSIIETATRLRDARKAFPTRGAWDRFVSEHLRWQPATVRGYLVIAKQPALGNVDIVHTLPPDQRTLRALARLSETQLRQLSDRYGGDLRHVGREGLLEDVQSLKPSKARTGAKRTAPRPAVRAATAKVHEHELEETPTLDTSLGPIEDDPLFLAGMLLKAVTSRTFDAEERKLLLEMIDDVRREIEAVEPESVAAIDDEESEVDADVEDEIAESASEEDLSVADADDAEVAGAQSDDDGGDGGQRYPLAVKCPPLSASEFAVLGDLLDGFVVDRSRDGTPYPRREDTLKPAEIIWVTVPDGAVAENDDDPADEPVPPPKPRIELKRRAQTNGKVVQMPRPAVGTKAVGRKGAR